MLPELKACSKDASVCCRKQRRYRQRLKDKDKDAAMEKERRRWHQRQAAGKITPISDLTERQKRAKRRYWKKYNNLRVQRKQVAVAQAEVSLNQNEIESVLTDCTPSMSCISVDSSSSRQRIRGRKVKRKDKSAAYRKINDLETKVVRLKRECERLRKQAERAKANVSGKRKRDLSIDENNNACDDDTPRKKLVKCQMTRKCAECSSFTMR